MVALSLHIAFIAVWSASLVYFPFLIMEQSQTGAPRHERLMLLQRWIYSMVMTPSALLAIVAGTWLVLERGFSGGWMPVKLAGVLVMAMFHGYCGALMVDLKRRGFRRSTGFYGALSVIPTTAILVVVTLVSAKPF